MGLPSMVLPYHETSILEVMGKYSAAQLVSLVRMDDLLLPSAD